MLRTGWKLRTGWIGLLIMAAACAQGGSIVTTATTDRPSATTLQPVEATVIVERTTTSASSTPTTVAPYARPEWLGTRQLPLRSDEHGEVRPTPPELRNRAFATIDVLPPPADDAFHVTSGPLPSDVIARSTYSDACPVGLGDLTYLTMTHWGFDQRPHTGEMIVNRDQSAAIVEVFEKLYAEKFPIEQMRVITSAEVEAPPTGDWNDTTSFVCRPAVGSGSWSMHAYGLAVDVNPFHNPYEKGDLVLPELASAFLDRDRGLPGMITPNDSVVEAFAQIGWTWGGDWKTLKDWMHFSTNGK